MKPSLPLCYYTLFLLSLLFILFLLLLLRLFFLRALFLPAHLSTLLHFFLLLFSFHHFLFLCIFRLVFFVFFFSNMTRKTERSWREGRNMDLALTHTQTLTDTRRVHFPNIPSSLEKAANYHLNASSLFPWPVSEWDINNANMWGGKTDSAISSCP